MSENGGFHMIGIFTIIFVCAKIFGIQPVADWSWWWVMAPLWIPISLIAGLVLILFAFVFIKEFVEEAK